MRRFVLLKAEENRRYKLLYEWNDALPKVLFIMLNPSYLRNEGEYSPTSLKIIQYAKDNGFGGVWVGNLFSYISPSPYRLINTPEDIIGKDNDVCIRQMSLECKEVVFAWGKYEFAKRRSEEILKMFPDGKTLGTNKDGSPAHPLSKNFYYAVDKTGA